MDQTFLLNQAYEESRYYRRFHHTIYTVFITVYIALLGFQISFPSSIEALRNQISLAIIFGIILFVLLPLYVCYIIIGYHKTVAYINAFIAQNTIGDKKEQSLNVIYNEATDILFFEKYYDILAKGRNPVRVGRGHLFLIMTFLCVVICNIIVFVFLNPSIA
jgi:hypothetical protein